MNSTNKRSLIGGFACLRLATMAFLTIAMTNGSVRAGCLLYRYWPMHGGDRIETRGPMGNCSFGFSASGTGFVLDDGCDAAQGMYEYRGEELLLTGSRAGWTRLTYDPPIPELTEAALTRDGTRRVTSSTRYQGFTITLVADIRITSIGAVQVPAGRFENCKQLSSTITGTIPGQGSMTVSVVNYVLAPGAGIIKVGVFDLDFRHVGWQEATGGVVGGVALRDWAPLSGQTAPVIARQPSSRTVTNRTSVAFSVGASGAGLAYLWMRNGVLLIDDGRVTGTRSSNLVINPVQMTDAGSYSVIVSNAACSTVSAVVPLTVVPGPTLLSGRCLAETSDGPPLPGTTIVLTGIGSGSRTNVTDSSGRYQFTGLVPGRYRVTPSKAGFHFEPSSQEIELSVEAEVPTMIGMRVPALRIAAVWSGQIPRVEFNRMPADPVRGIGPGSVGASEGLMVFGARASDGLGSIGAAVEVDPPQATLRERVIVRVMRTDETRAELKRSRWTPGAVGLSFSIPGPWVECELEAWVDSNGNQTVDAEESSTLVKGPGRMAVVSKSGYTDAIGQLRARSGFGLSGLVLPVAYRFLDSFLDHETPDQASILQECASIRADDPALDYAAGVGFTDGSTGCVPTFGFGSRTDVARRVMGSTAIRRAVVAAVGRNLDLIRTTFADPGGAECSFPLFGPGVDDRIEFPKAKDDETWKALDWDMYYAFHGADLLDAVVQVRRGESDAVHLRGVLTDLYDFGWQRGEVSGWAIQVQAGFPSLGEAGRIFRLKVDLEGMIPNIRSDGRPALRLRPAGGLGGVDYYLECTCPSRAMAEVSTESPAPSSDSGLKAVDSSTGTTLEVQVTEDLVNWRTFARPTWVDGTAEVPIPSVREGRVGQFYRIAVLDE